VWRDQNYRLSFAFDDAPRQIGHSIDRIANFGDSVAADFGHHDRRMRGNAGKD